MADRSLRTDLLGRDVSLGRTLNKGARDVDTFGRRTGRSFERAGAESGRRYGLRLSKSLGGGITASTGIVSKGARLMGGALAGIGITKLAADSVTMAATFDKTMRQTAQVAKIPQRQMGELRDVALDMGAKTSFSAREAGNAMLALGKGGLSFADQKAGALSSTLTLAAAGGIELGDAAQFVVQGLKTFGLRADQSATVAAALAGAANASTASVEDMGLALSQTGAGARNAGLSIQETTAVLAAFADNGIKGSDAGTSFKTMLQRLLAPTGAARAEMQRLGLSFTNARGEMLPITEISQRLQDRLKGLSQSQRAAALQTIFGSDATRAATILMREGSAGLAKYIKATSDRAAAEKLAKTNTEGAAGALERLRGAIETVQIKGGDLLLPMLADAASTIADRVIPAVERWVRSFAHDLGPQLGRMRDAWNENKDALFGLVTGLAGSEAQLTSTGDKARTLADSVVALSNAAGDTSRALTSLGGGLNNVEAASDRWGSAIFKNVVDPANKATKAVGEWIGINQVVGFIARDVSADLADIGIRFGQTAAATDKATSAFYLQTDAIRAEKQAMDALKGALQGEEDAELDLRQAKLNVSSAQARLTELAKGGRRGSLLYQQAQIDLRRAQIELKAKTDAYKASQLAANAATRGAMSAAQRAQGPLAGLGRTAETAGKKVVQMGLDARRGINLIPNRRVSVTANYNTTAPRGIELLIEKGLVRRAGGGGVWGAGTTSSDSIPAMLSDEEHVVEADAVKGAGGGSFKRGHQVLEGLRKRWRGFAAGGPALKINQIGTGTFLARPGRFDRNIAASLNLAAKGFAALVRQHKDVIFGGGKAEVRRFIQSMDPLPYIWGGAGPGGYDCSGAVGAAHLAHLGRPHGHGQRLYTTGSIHAGIAGLKSGLGGTLEIGVTPSRGHMVGRYGGKRGLKFEARSTRTGIFVGPSASAPEGFARHYHLARGGPVTLEELLASPKRLDIGGDTGVMRVKAGRRFHRGEFDDGGYLMPGTTVAQNSTGRPERVLAPNEPVIDYRRLGQEVARALAGVQLVVRPDNVHASLLAYRRDRGGRPLNLG